MSTRNIIKLVMGDPSDDGHGKSDSYIIVSNLTRRELRAAYTKGSEMVGFDLAESIAANYEDNKLPLDKYERLQEHGNEINYERYEDEVYLNTDTFVETYLFVAKLGNPELTYETLALESIDIGGYGLFWA